MTTIPSDELVATRESLHMLAEHLLAATRKRATGQITLVPVANGFGIPQLPDGTVLSLIGTDLVVAGPAGERRAPVTTLAQAAALAGVRPGFPWTKHPPATPFALHQPLVLHEAAAKALAGWFAIGRETLSGVAGELSTLSPATPQIFPEHFDLGITVGDVNYGFSPGDAGIPDPYLYIGPHGGPPEDGDPFWNAPFGAYRTWHDVSSATQASEFLLEGHRHWSCNGMGPHMTDI
jgi:hypothetical protein